MKWGNDYRIYRMHLDRQALANSVDPDVDHQELHCLPLIQQFLDTSGVKLFLLKF